MIEKIANVVLDSMESKARELGVAGVAVFMKGVLTKKGDTMQPYVRVVDRFERPAEPESRGQEDTGTNYFGVVFSKLAEMLSTLCDSGHANRPPRTGEFGWKGGIAFIGDDIIRYYFAFSGGTPEQDVSVAESGKDVLVGLDRRLLQI